jgi:hypothetical protein
MTEPTTVHIQTHTLNKGNSSGGQEDAWLNRYKQTQDGGQMPS